MDDSLTGLVLLGAIILLNAVLKMSYGTLINAHKAKLKDLADDGDRRAARAFNLANDATRLLASQQIVDLALRFGIALVAAVAIVPPLRDALLQQDVSSALASLIAYGGVLFLAAIATLVFGEILPTTIALGYADALARRVAGPLDILSRALGPMLRLLYWISDNVARSLVGRTALGLVTEEEIKMLVDAGSEGGAIEDEEKEMIYSIFQFGDTLTREVMVPRIDMVALEMNTPLPQALNTIVEAGHSRIPIYEETIDHIRGLLYAKDLLASWRDGEMERPIRDMLRPAHFVPESKKAGDLLQDMQQRKVHVAIVVDEYGGTAGLVTLEDLIEEIVGEIRDEYDVNEEEVYQKVGEHEYLFDAGIDLDDLNRLLDADLPTEDSDTLAGYIFSKLGKVPVVGETLSVDNLHMEVLSVDEKRIRKIRLVITPPAREAGEHEDIREEPAAAPD